MNSTMNGNTSSSVDWSPPVVLPGGKLLEALSDENVLAKIEARHSMTISCRLTGIEIVIDTSHRQIRVETSNHVVFTTSQKNQLAQSFLQCLQRNSATYNSVVFDLGSLVLEERSSIDLRGVPSLVIHTRGGCFTRRNSDLDLDAGDLFLAAGDVVCGGKITCRNLITRVTNGGSFEVEHTGQVRCSGAAIHCLAGGITISGGFVRQYDGSVENSKLPLVFKSCTDIRIPSSGYIEVKNGKGDVILESITGSIVITGRISVQTSTANRNQNNIADHVHLKLITRQGNILLGPGEQVYASLGALDPGLSSHTNSVSLQSEGMIVLSCPFRVQRGTLKLFARRDIHIASTEISVKDSVSIACAAFAITSDAALRILNDGVELSLDAKNGAAVEGIIDMKRGLLRLRPGTIICGTELHVDSIPDLNEPFAGVLAKSVHLEEEAGLSFSEIIANGQISGFVSHVQCSLLCTGPNSELTFARLSLHGVIILKHQGCFNVSDEFVVQTEGFDEASPRTPLLLFEGMTRTRILRFLSGLSPRDPLSLLQCTGTIICNELAVCCPLQTEAHLLQIGPNSQSNSQRGAIQVLDQVSASSFPLILPCLEEFILTEAGRVILQDCRLQVTANKVSLYGSVAGNGMLSVSAETKICTGPRSLLECASCELQASGKCGLIHIETGSTIKAEYLVDLCCNQGNIVVDTGSRLYSGGCLVARISASEEIPTLLKDSSSLPTISVDGFLEAAGNLSSKQDEMSGLFLLARDGHVRVGENAKFLVQGNVTIDCFKHSCFLAGVLKSKGSIVVQAGSVQLDKVRLTASRVEVRSAADLDANNRTKVFSSGDIRLLSSDCSLLLRECSLQGRSISLESGRSILLDTKAQLEITVSLLVNSAGAAELHGTVSTTKLSKPHISINSPDINVCGLSIPATTGSSTLLQLQSAGGGIFLADPIWRETILQNCDVRVGTTASSGNVFPKIEVHIRSKAVLSCTSFKVIDAKSFHHGGDLQVAKEVSLSVHSLVDFEATARVSCHEFFLNYSGDQRLIIPSGSRITANCGLEIDWIHPSGPEGVRQDATESLSIAGEVVAGGVLTLRMRRDRSTEHSNDAKSSVGGEKETAPFIFPALPPVIFDDKACLQAGGPLLIEAPFSRVEVAPDADLRSDLRIDIDCDVLILSGSVSAKSLLDLHALRIHLTGIINAEGAISVRAGQLFVITHMGSASANHLTVTAPIILMCSAAIPGCLRGHSSLSMESCIEISILGICMSFAETHSTLIRLASPACLSLPDVPDFESLKNSNMLIQCLLTGIKTMVGPTVRAVLDIGQAVFSLAMNLRSVPEIFSAAKQLVEEVKTKGIYHARLDRLVTIVNTVFRISTACINAYDASCKIVTSPTGAPSDDPSMKTAILAMAKHLAFAVLIPSVTTFSVFSCSAATRISGNIRDQGYSITSFENNLVAGTLTIDAHSYHAGVTSTSYVGDLVVSARYIDDRSQRVGLMSNSSFTYTGTDVKLSGHTSTLFQASDSAPIASSSSDLSTHARLIVSGKNVDVRGGTHEVSEVTIIARDTFKGSLVDAIQSSGEFSGMANVNHLSLELNNKQANVVFHHDLEVFRKSTSLKLGGDVTVQNLALHNGAEVKLTSETGSVKTGAISGEGSAELKGMRNVHVTGAVNISKQFKAEATGAPSSSSDNPGAFLRGDVELDKSVQAGDVEISAERGRASLKGDVTAVHDASVAAADDLILAHKFSGTTGRTTAASLEGQVVIQGAPIGSSTGTQTVIAGKKGVDIARGSTLQGGSGLPSTSDGSDSSSNNFGLIVDGGEGKVKVIGKTLIGAGADVLISGDEGIEMVAEKEVKTWTEKKGGFFRKKIVQHTSTTFLTTEVQSERGEVIMQSKNGVIALQGVKENSKHGSQYISKGGVFLTALRGHAETKKKSSYLGGTFYKKSSKRHETLAKTIIEDTEGDTVFYASEGDIVATGFNIRSGGTVVFVGKNVVLRDEILNHHEKSSSFMPTFSSPFANAVRDPTAAVQNHQAVQAVNDGISGGTGAEGGLASAANLTTDGLGQIIDTTEQLLSPNGILGVAGELGFGSTQVSVGVQRNKSDDRYQTLAGSGVQANGLVINAENKASFENGVSVAIDGSAKISAKTFTQTGAALTHSHRSSSWSHSISGDVATSQVTGFTTSASRTRSNGTSHASQVFQVRDTLELHVEEQWKMDVAQTDVGHLQGSAGTTVIESRQDTFSSSSQSYTVSVQAQDPQNARIGASSSETSSKTTTVRSGLNIRSELSDGDTPDSFQTKHLELKGGGITASGGVNLTKLESIKTQDLHDTHKSLTRSISLAPNGTLTNGQTGDEVLGIQSEKGGGTQRSFIDGGQGGVQVAARSSQGDGYATSVNDAYKEKKTKRINLNAHVPVETVRRSIATSMSGVKAVQYQELTSEEQLTYRLDQALAAASYDFDSKNPLEVQVERAQARGDFELADTLSKFEVVQALSDERTLVIQNSSDQTVKISYRGTLTFSDLINDIGIALNGKPLWGNAADQAHFEATREQFSQFTISTTGHSLGGTRSAQIHNNNGVAGSSFAEGSSLPTNRTIARTNAAARRVGEPAPFSRALLNSGFDFISHFAPLAGPAADREIRIHSPNPEIWAHRLDNYIQLIMPKE